MMRKITLFAPLALAACSATSDSNLAGSNDTLASTGSTATPVGNANGAPQSGNPAAPNGAATTASSGMPLPPNPSNDCANVAGSDFKAWVNAMPGPGSRPKLIVTGTITTPTAGYRVLFTDMRVAESSPVQVRLELAAVPPAGMAAQVITRHEVRGTWPMSPPVGSVTVRCGVKTLATISPVETAH